MALPGISLLTRFRVMQDDSNPASSYSNADIPYAYSSSAAAIMDSYSGPTVIYQQQQPGGLLPQFSSSISRGAFYCHQRRKHRS